MKKLTFLAFLTAFAWNVKAQIEKQEIVTDRPDQTEAPGLVPQGGLQVESGFVYESDEHASIELTNFVYNSSLIKYGVNENLELRLIAEYLGERIEGEAPRPSKFEGFSPLAVGVKLKISDENGFWPQAAMIGHISLKTGSREFEPDHTAADFRFTLAHTLSDRFSLSYNVGAEWDGQTPEATFLYTLALAYVISDRVGFYIESYSFFPEDGKADNRADGGFTVKFTPVVQWDISAGLGLSSNAPDYFLGTGLSFRLFK